MESAYLGRVRPPPKRGAPMAAGLCLAGDEAEARKWPANQRHAPSEIVRVTRDILRAQGAGAATLIEARDVAMGDASAGKIRLSWPI